jgi:hypothetical protein
VGRDTNCFLRECTFRLQLHRATLQDHRTMRYIFNMGYTVANMAVNRMQVTAFSNRFA